MTASQIDKLRKFVDRRPAHFIACEGPYEKPDSLSMTALLAEIDALKAKGDAQTPPQPRRLREYKGVTYREGEWYKEGLLGGIKNVFNALYCFFAAATDDDYRALLALRDDPYEPVETLESVVDKWWEELVGSAVDVPALCTRLRAHLSQQTPTLTAGEHIAALVAMGAWRANRVDVERSSAHRRELYPNDGRLVIAEDRNALILPPEVSP